MEYTNVMLHINYLVRKYGSKKAYDIICESEESLNKALNKLTTEPIKLENSCTHESIVSVSPYSRLDDEVKPFATFKLSELGSIIAKIISAMEEKEFIPVCVDETEGFYYGERILFPTYQVIKRGLRKSDEIFKIYTSRENYNSLLEKVNEEICIIEGLYPCYSGRLENGNIHFQWIKPLYTNRKYSYVFEFLKSLIAYKYVNQKYNIDDDELQLLIDIFSCKRTGVLTRKRIKTY